MEDLRRDGTVDIAGNPLVCSLYRSTIDLDLSHLLLAAPMDRILMLQMTATTELRAPMANVVMACADNGLTVATAAAEHDEARWLGATGRTVIETTTSVPGPVASVSYERWQKAQHGDLGGLVEASESSAEVGVIGGDLYGFSSERSQATVVATISEWLAKARAS